MTQRLRAELAEVVEEDGAHAGDARSALGEGPARQRLKSAILALAEHRGPHSSICPSDAARVVGDDNWRELMDDARDLARELAKSGDVQITQRGTTLDPNASWSGPIRIRIAER